MAEFSGADQAGAVRRLYAAGTPERADLERRMAEFLPPAAPVSEVTERALEELAERVTRDAPPVTGGTGTLDHAARALVDALVDSARGTRDRHTRRYHT
ncbi:hypothetical protein BST28_17445 [Mycolicibacter kumamotonensis]|uniref:Uncharacterized protein n=1 Tax=Mycolicibacter kumamotonensis TaxID=354243 RepID=A0A1X0DZ05_9MYCO|nr:hypothetical protein BST28_17445 [Mycolicibacter kumamotonensis]